ncbi:hypothetical protein CRG98_016056 [Punica granatum]|uniref:F-box domain-containing protein n=1 Tax=Punica granatum TaxID=22663 RepID=A0A2I0K4S4_PUNGR|nr:hypothetical protein CRG98_016056 [Punica granatum]
MNRDCASPLQGTPALASSDKLMARPALASRFFIREVRRVHFSNRSALVACVGSTLPTNPLVKARGGQAADMDGDDKISLLPEHVKHRILSFIPSIKEVVRTSSLSKSWLRTWRSFQVTDFDQSLILPDSAIHQFVGARRWNEYSESFVRFVDDALMRSRDGMPRFQILATAEMAPHVDKWVGMALDYHVEELSINI